MLTPRFNITQTEHHLILVIHAPYTQLKDVEINAIGTDFWFYSSPYFLRLNFPFEVVDDDEPPASFNSDKGEFEIKLQKQTPGQHFPDLDLLGSLLAPKKEKANIKPTIEILSGTDGADSEEEEMVEEDEDEWLIDQKLPSSESVCSPLSGCKYGFGNLTQGVFSQVKTEFREIIDLPDPDRTTYSERHSLREAQENDKFCPDHYLADFMEPDELEAFLTYKPVWTTLACDEVKLTDVEKESLKKLGNKEFLLSKDDKKAAWLSLIDIVFAWAYNHRTTLGDYTVESAWTINKLSATLSWFTSYVNLESAVTTSIRRSLCFGLYRHWELSQLVLKDTIAILKLGRRQILKCLLEVHSLFAQCEPRYLLNQLYITDYCIWLQKASDSKLAKLTGALEKVVVTKSDIGFELEELEQAALLVKEEEDDEVLRNQVAKLALTNNPARNTESSSESKDSDSSSSEEDSDSSDSLDSDDDSSPES